MFMYYNLHKIRRNDVVEVKAGRDKGKRGKVLRMLYAIKPRAIVEGVNLVKKHQRRKQQEQQSQIVEVPQPVSASNLMLICKNCNRAVRVGFSVLKDGSKSRICKKCGEPL